MSQAARPGHRACGPAGRPAGGSYAGPRRDRATPATLVLASGPGYRAGVTSNSWRSPGDGGSDSGRYDLAVVGAGIVGLAVAREFARRRPDPG